MPATDSGLSCKTWAIIISRSGDRKAIAGCWAMLFNQDRGKAEIFAKAIEESIRAIEEKADERIAAKKETIKSELYNELRSELATKEFVRAEINQLRSEFSEVRSEIKQNALLLKILMGIAVFGLTLFNPSFVKLVELFVK